MEGTPGESKKGSDCSLAVTLLHATDLRHVPLILTYGLFSGIDRAPLASGDERGKAYTREIVARQGRKGWEIIIVAFDIPAAWTTEAEERPRRAHVASGGERSLERLRIGSRLPSGRSLSILRQSKNNMAVSQGRPQEECAVL